MHFFIVLILPILFLFLNFLIPLHKLEFKGLDREMLEAKYGDTPEALARGLLALLSIGLSIWGLSELMYHLYSITLLPEKYDLKFLPASFFYWFLMCFGVGLFLGLYIYLLISKILYRANFHELLEYQEFDGKGKIGGVTEIREICFWVIAVFIIPVFLLSDYCVNIKEDRIVFNDFWSLKDRQYRFGDIEAVHFVYYKQFSRPNRIEYQPYYIFKFPDGETWETDSSEVGMKVIRHIVNRTYVKLDTNNFDPDSYMGKTHPLY